MSLRSITRGQKERLKPSTLEKSAREYANQKYKIIWFYEAIHDDGGACTRERRDGIADAWAVYADAVEQEARPQWKKRHTIALKIVAHFRGECQCWNCWTCPCGCGRKFAEHYGKTVFRGQR